MGQHHHHHHHEEPAKQLFFHIVIHKKTGYFSSCSNELTVISCTEGDQFEKILEKAREATAEDFLQLKYTHIIDTENGKKSKIFIMVKDDETLRQVIQLNGQDAFDSSKGIHLKLERKNSSWYIQVFKAIFVLLIIIAFAVAVASIMIKNHWWCVDQALLDDFLREWNVYVNNFN